MRKMFFFSRARLAQSRLRLYSSIVFVLLPLAVVSVLSMDWLEGKQVGKGLTPFLGHQKITVQQAGFFSWPKTPQKRDVDDQTVKLFFKGVRVAPNGNGIISGVARPGYNIYIKKQGKEVAIAKSAPDGSWSTIIEGVLEGESKTYELFSETPDGQVQHQAKQKLVIAIPDNKMNGAVVKITEEGKVPLVVAEDLSVSMLTDASAQAADVSPKKNASELSILSAEYINNEAGTGTVVASGKSAKNAALQLFVNDSELGKVTADEEGNWKLSEEFAVEPNSANTLSIKQVDQAGKVLRTETATFSGSAATNGAEENTADPEVKKKTFWGTLKEMFMPGSKPDEEKKKEAEAPKPGSETPEEKNAVLTVPPSITVPEPSPVQSSKTPSAEAVGDLGKKGKQDAKNEINKPAQPGTKNTKQGASDLSSVVADKKVKSGNGKPVKASPFRRSASRQSRNKTGKSGVKSGHKAKVRKGKRARRRARNSRKKYRQRRASRLRKKSRLKRKPGSRWSKRKRRIRKRRLLHYSKRTAAKKRRLRMRRKRARLAIYRRRHHRRRLKRYTRRHALRNLPVLSRRKYRRTRRRMVAIRRKRRIRVRRGDTLWDLARIRYGHGRYYHRIFRANRRRMKNPNRLRPNQRLFLPA